MEKRVYWIEKPKQVRTMVSPIRHDIVDRLTTLGPISARALAEALGCKTTAIYRHLVLLQKHGLVVAELAPNGRGRPTMIYRTVAPVIRLARAPRARVNHAPLSKIARTLARQAGREYGAAFRSGNWASEGTGRNHWFFEMVMTPSRRKLGRINDLMDELALLIWTPDQRPGPPVRVTWIMSPPLPKRTRRRRRPASS